MVRKYNAQTGQFEDIDEDVNNFGQGGYGSIQGLQVPLGVTAQANDLSEQNRVIADRVRLNKANIPDFNSQKQGFGFNQGTLGAAGSVLGGLGRLAQGWASIKSLGLAKKAFAQESRIADANLANQETTINNQIRARQRYIQGTQANTDISHLQLVGG
jgi:hypothetical protein